MGELKFGLVAGVVVLSVVWTGKNPDRAQSPAATARGVGFFIYSLVLT
jgi:hypothetical protein